MITLISLPSPFLQEPAMNPPLGLCSIGTVIKEAGYKVKVIDFAIKKYNYSSDEYLYELPLGSKYYGISCVSAQFKWFKEVVRYLNKYSPESIIIAGGPHVSSEIESCLDVGVDIAFNGEGEESILDILSGKKWGEIPGVCYDLGGEYLIKPRVFVEDLNKIPLPDFSLFEIDKYERRLFGEKAFHIMTLRGCPYNCNFCDSNAIGGAVRYIDEKRIIDWIDTIIEKYKIKNFVIYDDTFTIKSKRVKYFCKEFKKRGIKWRCWSRANSLRYDDLVAMKDSGLESISIGVESGSPLILKNINKMTTVEHNRKAIEVCKKAGVPVRCSLMFGNPGECGTTLRETVDFIQETQPDEWNISILMPAPGSEFWINPEKHGLSFDKKKIIEDDYQELNRSSRSGMGNINVVIDTMPKHMMINYLDWFVQELERVCPRKTIRDVVQNIKVESLQKD